MSVFVHLAMILCACVCMYVCMRARLSAHVSRGLFGTAGDLGLSTDDEGKSDTSLPLSSLHTYTHLFPPLVPLVHRQQDHIDTQAFIVFSVLLFPQRLSTKHKPACHLCIRHFIW